MAKRDTAKSSETPRASSSRSRARAGRFRRRPSSRQARALHDAGRVRAHVPPLDRRPRGLLGRDGARRADLVQAVDQGARLAMPPWAQVVRGRQAQRLGQLPRPPPGHAAANKAAHRSGRASRATARTLTYQRAARARSASSPTCSRRSASKAGDRVAIYMPMVPEVAIAMLACARIGATHTVVFGGFSRRGAARPHQRLPGQGRHHRRRRLAPRQGRAAQGQRRRRAGADARRVENVRRRAAAPATPVDDEGRAATTGGTSSMADALGRLPAPSRSTPSTRSSSSTPRASTGKPKGILHTTGGYLLGAHLTTQVGLRPQRRRHLLVHRRRRLGHRPQLRRLRPARRTARPP